MRDAILHFPAQFIFEPKIINAKSFSGIKAFFLCGMGGSALGGDILKAWQKDLPLFIHKDYDLPFLPSKTLIIADSYSGNTEEIISSFTKALEKKFPLIAISTGGKLKELAYVRHVPYIQLPDIGIQPRAALGFQLTALAHIIASVLPGKRFLMDELKDLRALSAQKDESRGKKLATSLINKTPLIYSSTNWQALGYNWKIKFNENAKIFAFSNVLPELNHNEMNAFDVRNSTKEISKSFYFIFLKDKNDHPRVMKRQDALEKILIAKGFDVENIALEGKNFLEKFFTSTLLVDWASYYLALEYNIDPEQVPLPEEFKRLIA